jgi:hypothetical protein
MKHVVDIAITNAETGEITCLDQREFETIEEAQEARENIISKLPDNCYAHFNKLFKRIVCECGEQVDCLNFTNTCDGCDSDYNFCGDLLAPREQWGCETGENPSDCY